MGEKAAAAHPIKNKETDTKYSFLEEKCSIRNPVQGIMDAHKQQIACCKPLPNACSYIKFRHNFRQ